MSRHGRLVALPVVAVLVISACGSPGTPSAISPAISSATPVARVPAASPSPEAVPSSAASSAATTPAAAASPGPSGPRVPPVPLAVVTGFSNYRVDSVTLADLASRLASGTLIVPCGAQAAIATALGAPVAAGPAVTPPGVTPSPMPAAPSTSCVAGDAIPSRLPASSTAIAILPPGLVTPALRVVPIGAADLFGETPARTAAYPLSVPAPAGWPATWTAYDPSNVRVVLTTGVNCPDRGVSYQTNVLGKGWDWLLRPAPRNTRAGTGTPPSAGGWWMPSAPATPGPSGR